jgi:DNA polymerase-3 subunit alpha
MFKTEQNLWGTECGCSKPSIYFSRDFGSRTCQNCGTIITTTDEPKQNLEFTHLRIHTHLSFLKAICKPEKLIEKAKEYGMTALAKTDFDTMCGAPSFVKSCQDNDIKPILGVEFEVKQDRDRYPVTFIALNREGYKNLVKLTTTAWCVRKPKNKKDVFVDISDIPNTGNVVALVEASPAAHLWLANIAQILPTYIGINDPTQNALAESLSAQYNCSVVVTGNVLYTNEEDKDFYGLALKIGNHDDRDLHASDNHFKSPDEIFELFSDHPEWIGASQYIADKVEDYGLVNKDFIIPSYKDKFGEWSIEEACAKLEQECWVKLHEKGLSGNKEYTDRLTYELATMRDKKFSSYFLIIWEIVEYMKATGKLKPFGRGSSVGSLVCYVLDIISMDPIRWSVPFERFINQGRIDLPDIDTDITQEGRGDVLRHIAEVHGTDRVAQIATYQTMQMKAAIDNVGRVLQVPHVVNRDLRKNVPDDLDDINDLDSDIKKQMAEASKVWIDAAEALYGTAKNLGYHAAGVVISDERLDELVPLLPEHDGIYGIQYDMMDCEILGLLKLDMLGLKTLDIIQYTIERVQDRYGVEINVYDLPPDDPDTYALISSGHYVSIFQLDSTGYRRLCRQLTPQNFDHTMALNALYRPGPLESGVTDQYIKRRHGKEEQVSWHPWLDSVLQDTYQTVLFQEQAMAMARIIAGFNDVEADKFRKGIGKKKKEIVDACIADFKTGALKQPNLTPPPGFEGNLETWIDDLTKKLEGYARYMWNRGHSCGYGWITYVTAYLEAHYPLEYYISLLDANVNKTIKLTALIRAILNKKIEIVPPSVNESSIQYDIGSDNRIYMGLSSIRSVGKAAQNIVDERTARGPFGSFVEFCQRLPSVNKTAKVNLVKAGAFKWDIMLCDRDKVLNVDIINKIAKKRNKKFDGSKVAPIQIAMKCHIDGHEYTEMEQQENERAVLNSFITGHPAAIYQRLHGYLECGNAKVICPITINQNEVGVGESVMVVGTVDSIVRKTTKPKIRSDGVDIGSRPYLNISVSDNESSINFNIWHPLCEDLEKRLVVGKVGMFECHTRRDKFREDMITVHVKNANMLSYGLPIQGVFWQNGVNIQDVLNKLGGIHSNTINMEGRNYSSVRGKLTVKPDIIEDIINDYTGISFLVSLD